MRERKRELQILLLLHLYTWPIFFFLFLSFSSNSNAADPKDHTLYEMVANTLPEDNLHTFTHIIAFLRLLLESMADSKTIGNVLGETLMH